MTAPRFRAAAASDQPAVKALIFAILDEYELDPSPATIDRDLDDLEGFYEGGVFDVLENGDGDIIGTVGLLPLDHGACELRKMYLKTQYRGRGLGQRMLKHAIARAREIGFHRMELQTARVLEEAIGLYQKFGFEPIEAAQMEKRCDQALALDLTNLTLIAANVKE